MKNLANDPVLAPVKAKLQSQLDLWLKQQGDDGIETEKLAVIRKGNARKPSAPLKN